MKKLFMMISLSAMALSLTACGGDDCEDAADRAADKAEDCGIDIGDAGDAEGGECSEEAGNLLQCQADCTEEASCEALKGTDLEGQNAWAACSLACAAEG